jgi:hypothetical protein
MERTACCHCGSLRATVSGEPTIVNVCHCKACQRRTGAVMHSGVYFYIQFSVLVAGCR